MLSTKSSTIAFRMPLHDIDFANSMAKRMGWQIIVLPGLTPQQDRPSRFSRMKDLCGILSDSEQDYKTLREEAINEILTRQHKTLWKASGTRILKI